MADQRDWGWIRKALGLTGLLTLGLTTFAPAPAGADPPPWANAHGRRAKGDKGDKFKKKYQESSRTYSRDRDYSGSWRDRDDWSRRDRNRYDDRRGNSRYSERDRDDYWNRDRDRRNKDYILDRADRNDNRDRLLDGVFGSDRNQRSRYDDRRNWDDRSRRNRDRDGDGVPDVLDRFPDSRFRQ